MKREVIFSPLALDMTVTFTFVSITLDTTRLFVLYYYSIHWSASICICPYVYFNDPISLIQHFNALIYILDNSSSRHCWLLYSLLCLSIPLVSVYWVPFGLLNLHSPPLEHLNYVHLVHLSWVVLVATLTHIYF